MNKKIIWAVALITLVAYAGYTAAINLTGTYSIEIENETYERYSEILEERNMTWDDAVNWLLERTIQDDSEGITYDELEGEYRELISSGNVTKLRTGYLALRYINNH